MKIKKKRSKIFQTKPIFQVNISNVYLLYIIICTPIHCIALTALTQVIPLKYLNIFNGLCTRLHSFSLPSSVAVYFLQFMHFREHHTEDYTPAYISSTFSPKWNYDVCEDEQEVKKEQQHCEWRNFSIFRLYFCITHMMLFSSYRATECRVYTYK